MLDIKFIKENKDLVAQAAKNKNREINVDEIIRLSEERRKLRGELDLINQKRKEAANNRDAETGTQLKHDLEEVEARFNEVDKQFIAEMIKVPNIYSADTPVAADESGNKVLRQWGEIPKFDFTPKEHQEIGEYLGIIDTETAAKVSGPRFSYLKGDLVLMEMALMRMAIDVLASREKLRNIIDEFHLSVSDKPFTLVTPPLLMRSAVMNRMARIDPIEERYYFEKDDLVFIGSAEHTLGPMHMDQIISESQFPIRYAALTPAFRREAGSYGKDTKGILRLHHFNKLEMESFDMPEDGLAEQDFMVAIQEHLLRQLRLPYQVVAICSGDMGFPDYRQIDIETWMPGQNKYRETHTSDYMGGFQARRLSTRLKRKDGTIEPVHMNDATALSQRPLIAIIENYQQADGSVKIPEVLVPYMNGVTEIRKS
jgi:seryl-tRNA synthetase